MVVKIKKYLSIANYLTLRADAFDKAQTTSICVVARIGTHGFSLVRSMGTQNSRGVVLLAILAKRLEILAVHAVLEPGLVDKDNHVGVFVPITIITAHDYPT